MAGSRLVPQSPAPVLAVDFGLQTTAGTYTVQAANASTGCKNSMSGSASVSLLALPSVYTVTGGGGYCTGGTGVHVGLNYGNTGINYQLYQGASTVGSPVAGANAAIDFGLQTTVGTYTVVGTNATTGCVNNMDMSATVSINSLPAVYNVTGGGSYCSKRPNPKPQTPNPKPLSLFAKNYEQN